MTTTINASTSSGLVNTADTSGSLALQTAGTTAVTLDTSQNATFAGNILGTASTFQVGVNTSGKDARFGVLSGGNGRVEFYSAGAEVMRLDTSGNLMLGQTTANGRLSILGSNADWNYNSAVTGGATTKLHIRFLGDAAVAGTVTSSGTSTTYGTSSDYRLKENVAPMQNALATVSLLKPVTYTWKADGKQSQGFIAHELQEVCPEAVVGEKDAVDKDGNIMPQNIDTSFLVATLTAAIQELKAELDATKAEVAALKGTV